MLAFGVTQMSNLGNSVAPGDWYRLSSRVSCHNGPISNQRALIKSLVDLAVRLTKLSCRQPTPPDRRKPISHKSMVSLTNIVRLVVELARSNQQLRLDIKFISN